MHFQHGKSYKAYSFSFYRLTACREISKSPFQPRGRALAVNAVPQSMAYGFAKNIWMIIHHYFGDNNLKLWKQKRRNNKYNHLDELWKAAGQIHEALGCIIHRRGLRIVTCCYLLGGPHLGCPMDKELPSCSITILQEMKMECPRTLGTICKPLKVY